MDIVRVPKLGYEETVESYSIQVSSQQNAEVVNGIGEEKTLTHNVQQMRTIRKAVKESQSPNHANSGSDEGATDDSFKPTDNHGWKTLAAVIDRVLLVCYTVVLIGVSVYFHIKTKY